MSNLKTWQQYEAEGRSDDDNPALALQGISNTVLKEFAANPEMMVAYLQKEMENRYLK